MPFTLKKHPQGALRTETVSCSVFLVLSKVTDIKGLLNYPFMNNKICGVPVLETGHLVLGFTLTKINTTLLVGFFKLGSRTSLLFLTH